MRRIFELEQSTIAGGSISPMLGPMTSLAWSGRLIVWSNSEAVLSNFRAPFSLTTDHLVCVWAHDIRRAAYMYGPPPPIRYRFTSRDAGSFHDDLTHIPGQPLPSPHQGGPWWFWVTVAPPGLLPRGPAFPGSNTTRPPLSSGRPRFPALLPPIPRPLPHPTPGVPLPTRQPPIRRPPVPGRPVREDKPKL